MRFTVEDKRLILGAVRGIEGGLTEMDKRITSLAALLDRLRVLLTTISKEVERGSSA